MGRRRYMCTKVRVCKTTDVREKHHALLLRLLESPKTQVGEKNHKEEKRRDLSRSRKKKGSRACVARTVIKESAPQKLHQVKQAEIEEGS